jgi:LPS O-antigen subunit length determinant protein (WzzB/FepE family)
MIMGSKPKVILIVAAVLLIAIGILAVYLTWPAEEAEEVIEEPEEETLEELLDRLTPKDAHPMTEEEKEEIENLLKQLTPTN